MRSMRRGTKEMDILLMRFFEAHLRDLDEADLDLYDALLDENDQDLYLWISAQADAPDQNLENPRQKRGLPLIWFSATAAAAAAAAAAERRRRRDRDR